MFSAIYTSVLVVHFFFFIQYHDDTNIVSLLWSIDCIFPILQVTLNESIC